MQQLLRELSERHITLEVSGSDRLQVNAPAGALTPELSALIRQHKAALVALLTRKAATEEQLELPQIAPAEEQRHEPFPLNAVQHAYWVGRNQHLELGGVATHFYFELECDGIDLSRLQTAFRNVVRRHDMLRAVVDAEGLQRVLKEVPDYTIRTLDLRGATEDRVQQSVHGMRSEMSQQVFDCSRWPLFEIRALRVSERRTLLFCSWDFLVVDAWSMLLIFRQWRQLYDAPGHESPPLALSFRDYVLAENQLRTTPAYTVPRHYWLERIDALPPAPLLPINTKIPRGRAFPFVRRRLRLPADQWRRLEQLAQAEAITPSSLLLAVFSEILDRWSKSRHYSLNLTLFNRLPLHAQVMELVGDFTTLIVTEVGRHRAPSFVERARAVQNQFLEDFAHRQFSGVEVLRELAKRRHLAQRAIMPVVFTSTLMLKQRAADEQQHRGVEELGKQSYGITQTPQVLLDCQIFEMSGELVVNWDAVEELFRSGVLDAMFWSFGRLLEVLCTGRQAWYDDHVVELPPHEQALRTRDHLSLQALPLESDADLLHMAFLRQALQRPDAVAVIHEEVSLSYGELLALSCTVAQSLIENGTRSGELVAVVMEKGWEQVVAVLGILIAGAAYLPVEPTLPLRRQRLLLTQGAARCAVTVGVLDESLTKDTGIAVIPVTRQGDRRLPQDVPVARQSPRDIAYVIYTSGSTGTPKGVAIDHRGALNTIAAMNRLFAVNADDRVLGVSSLSFDLSVYDIFGPLSVGGCLVLPPARAAKDPDYWSRVIERHGVTLWNSAPQLMSMLVDYNEMRPGYDLRSIRSVWLSGDWIPPKLPRRIRTLLGEVCQVVSLGGATEGSIWSIYHVIEGDTSDLESVPYGKALPGQAMMVLDQDLQPCPAHVIGNIYIGGIGVAVGYWRDPERTERQFIVHPRTQERLYCTGDLGRYFDDGTIEFLGREDEQVKIHGHRVELGEICAQLKSIAYLEDAVVDLAESGGARALIAYVVPAKTAVSPLFVRECAEPGAQAGLVHGLAQLGDVAPSDTQREDLQHFDHFWTRMSALCLATMHATLRELGVAGSDDAIEAAGGAGVLERYHALLEKWLEVLQGAGWLERTGKSVRSVAGRVVEVPELLVQFDAEFGRDERVRGFYQYMRRCFDEQRSLLTGRTLPLELLFPQGSLALAAGVYADNAVAALHHRQLAGVLEIILESRRGQGKLRVLELGAGVGGTTESVLPLLAPHVGEYWFTDVSPVFLEQAKRKFAGHACVRHALIDIQRDYAGQGLQWHSFDLIFAANVLHNAKDTVVALDRVRRLLRPGGQLVLLEGTRETPWLWVSVGYLETVGPYADQRAASYSPILDRDGWHAALLRAGFEQVTSWPRSGSDADTVGAILGRAMPMHVILAVAPSEILRFDAHPLREHLAAVLPGYMVPQQFVELDRLPLTANGKVDRAALQPGRPIAAGGEREVVPARAGTEQLILGIWREVLALEAIGVTESFFDVGGDSLMLTRVLGKLNRTLRHKLSMADLFAYPSIRSLAEHVSALAAADAPSDLVVTAAAGALPAGAQMAIIGMSGRFPDAPNLQVFWENLCAGVCSVRHWDEEVLRKAGVEESLLRDPHYVKAGVRVDGLDLFDAEYFGFSPREAQITDPQVRWLLEGAVEALERAGYRNERYAGEIGVFLAKDTSQYFTSHLQGRSELLQSLGPMAIANGNEKDYAATLISYKLGLTGPSLNISTACSSSLVAIHQACLSLRNGECSIALAGGVALETLQPTGYLYRDGSTASPDGYCRAFSADSAGTVRGSGLGLVVIKPLDKALQDGDTVHAVIGATAINNDGAGKVGFTAPSAHGQAKVIATALARAGLSAADVQYVEAHGTGTALGDPIEIQGLAAVYNRSSGARCAIGSLKTNIGHLDVAAGVAGLIKTVLALERAQIPPSLHFRAPNPRIDFGGGAIYVNHTLSPWPRSGKPRRAGVSSFGVGGTNAHVILEQAPMRRPVEADEGRPQLVVLSARGRGSLDRMAQQLAAAILADPAHALADVAFTLQVGRNAHRCRRTCVVDTTAQLRESLLSEASVAVLDEQVTPSVIFAFPGEWELRKDVSWHLYEDYPAFREHMDKCAELLISYVGQDIRPILYSRYAARSGEAPPDVGAAVDAGLDALLLFAIEYSLAQLWIALGVRPEGMIGEGLGEYVAACLAGVFSLEEVLSVLVVQDALLRGVEHSRLLTVRLGEAELAPLIEATDCRIAAANAPLDTVVVGSEPAVANLRSLLEQHGVASSPADGRRVSRGALQGIAETLTACLRKVVLGPVSVPFVSCLTGRWISTAQAQDPVYWAGHPGGSVRLSAAFAELSAQEHRCYLEIGPGTRLLELMQANGFARDRITSSLGHAGSAQGERREFLHALGALWSNGVEPDWPAVHGALRPARVSLPTYAFERQSYWLPPVASGQGTAVRGMEGPAVSGAVSANSRPVAGHPRPALRSDYVAPQGPLRQRLAELWQAFLGIDTVGAEDNFFELGGDSVLGVQLSEKMRQDLAIEIPLEKLLQLGTIGSIANYHEIISGRLPISALSDVEVDRIIQVYDGAADAERISL